MQTAAAAKIPACRIKENDKEKDDMEYKVANMELATKIASVPFWRPEYFPKYFTESFTMDYPAPPPGMPNHFDVWEAERCFEWLNRTVRSWKVDLEEFYSTPDPNQFWAIGYCSGDVYWGNHDGHYESKYIMRIEMKDGKVNYIKGMIEPIRMLKAAGIDVKPLHKGIDDPKVDEYLEAHPEARTKREAKVFQDPSESVQDIDMSPEAIEERKNNNLKESACGVEREKYRRLTTANPAFAGAAWFVPDDRPWMDPPGEPVMINNNKLPPREAQIRIHAWIKSSSPWMYRDTRSKIYQTDDEHVWFVEMNSHGPSRWHGNGCENGHYHQPYFLIIKFDDAGRMTHRAEILSPVYKYNSANLSIPSFPYYM